MERLQAQAVATRDAIQVVVTAIPAAAASADGAEGKLVGARTTLEEVRADNRAMQREITWGTLGIPSGLSCVAAVLLEMAVIFAYAAVQVG